MALQSYSPAQAHAFAPGNGFVSGRLAAAMSDVNADAASRRRADELGRLALRQDATSLDAVVALGLNAQLRNDSSAASRFFRYAELLSQRDLQTQLWFINDAIAHDDISATLLHYDVALRTSRSAAALLFPVLSTAIADPHIREGLVERLARRPPWTGAFMSFVVANETDPTATVALFRALSIRGVAIPEAVSAKLVAGLLASGRTDLAWAYYLTSHNGVSRLMSRNPDFHNSTQVPTALDWVPVNAGSISAAIQPNGGGGGGGVLTFNAPPSVGGVAVTQVELFPSGIYDLVGESREIDQPADSHPYWLLRCSDGRELGRVEIPNSADLLGKFAGKIEVPEDCPMQILALILRPSSRISGVSGQIEHTLLQVTK